jgi:hypothetical protein
VKAHAKLGVEGCVEQILTNKGKSKILGAKSTF